MYQRLLSIGQVVPVPLTPLQPPFPQWYKPDQKCEYHDGVVDTILMDVLHSKEESFNSSKLGGFLFDESPNVNSNPLPNHASGSGVNSLEIGMESKATLRVTMDKLYGMLRQTNYLKTPVRMQAVGDANEYCKYHQQFGHDIDSCEEFHLEVENMMTLGMLRLMKPKEDDLVGTMTGCNEKVEVCRYVPTEKGPPKMILTKPMNTVSGSYNAQPYNYGYSFHSTNPALVFHAEVGGLTRSGRCFTPEELENHRKAKGKDMTELTKTDEVNKPVSDEEANEFLKLMKHSEYSVVDQLKKTPARISLLSLILSSELHRNALQKVLNEAYVPQDITQDSIGHLVGRIQATNYLYFTDDELDHEGTGHNKPLHITVKCKDCVIAKVLIDNGSSLNVLPRHVLDKMPVDASHMKPSTMTARAYDGSSRPISGSIDVELIIGPQPFQVTLQVIDIHPSYSILLGRPWIHAARAVASSLHQRVKFIINGNLVTVRAEETLSMIKNVSIPYIETEESKDENMHAFEVVNAEWVPENTVRRKPEISEAAKMATKYFLKHGLPFQYDHTTGMPERINVIKMKCADQRFGLGFKPGKADFKRAAEIRREKRIARIERREPDEDRIEIPPIHVTFPRSAYVIKTEDYEGELRKEFNGATINYLEYGGEQDLKEEDNAHEQLPQLTIGILEDDSFVRKLAEGEDLANWEIQEVPIVFKKKSESGSSYNPQTHCTVDNWPNFDETIIAMDEEEFGEEDIHEFAKLAEQSDRTWKPAKEELELINVGTVHDKRELKIGKLISADVRSELIALLQEYIDVFAWSYADMPGLDTDIVVHKLPLIEGCKPVKQKLRRTRPDILIKVKEEITKQWDAGFLEVVDYSQWVSNIVVVPKKDNKIRVCVDFRDLNKASPKDNFPLPHIDVLVDNAAKSSTYSFMDGFSGYNQIKMAEQDKKKTTFVTPWGTYCYKVMPFGLKNAGATYQRAMIPDKVKAIQAMSAPKTEKERNPGVWDEDCQEAFDKIKQYLQNPPLLVPPVPGKPLILYLTVTESAMGYYEPLNFDFPDEDVLVIESDWWTMYFDGAVNVSGNGAGAVIISPEGKQYPISIKLQFNCTNNTAEYEACIHGLEAALELKIRKLETKGEWQTKDEKLKPYQEYLSKLAEDFEEIEFNHLGRDKNQFADALATLASMATIDCGIRVHPIGIDIRSSPAHSCLVEEEVDGSPWYADIKRFIQYREYPFEASKNRSEDSEKNDQKPIKPCMKCMEEFAPPMANGHMMARQMQRAGYFWLTMEKDCIEFVRKCHKCQVYSDKINAPPVPLFNMVSPWPFAMWGIDVIGPINPKASNGHRFILVAIDYFTKVAANKNIKKIVQKMVVTYKDWQEWLPYALHAYRTAVRTSTGATPYSLVYGMEAVMPLEVEIPSLRVLMESELEEAKWAEIRYEQLNMISEKRLAAICHHQLYQNRIARAYDRKVRSREFKEGDLVLRKILSLPSENHSKWAPNYEGPYVVKRAFSGGALILTGNGWRRFE
ncbi:uncharacterized protein [Populus alba]|uniref:uncharacterized protein n=1 Tax=Populus alba TaxID=43335 RepID=UPI003CC736F1